MAELLAGALEAPGGASEQPLEGQLSHRECQVFRLLAAGRSVGAIAEPLVLAPNAVSTYRARILRETGVRNDVELSLLAVRQALRQRRGAAGSGHAAWVSPVMACSMQASSAASS